MKHILCLLWLCLIAIGSFAQQADFTKMSFMVRDACRADIQEKMRLQKVQALNGLHKAKNAYLTAFVKLSEPDPAPLTARGCKVLAQYGRLCIAAIPPTQIGSLSLDRRVMRMEAGRRATAMMDTTRIITHANIVNEGINLPHGFKGKGVVVGVQDIGFDLTHPTFWSADKARYRIKALWDQLSTDTLSSTLPAGRDYCDSTTLIALGRPRDGDTQTHGTHTAGIAAGAETPMGIAPEADLCLVCNATSDDAELIDSSDYYKYTYALDALGFKYIFDYADSVGKPCVINFSEGSQEDLRGDDMLYYEMLDSLTGPGHIIVASAGNYGTEIKFLHKPAEVSEARIFVSSLWHQKSMSFATSSTDSLEMRLMSGNRLITDFSMNKLLHAADSMISDTVVADGTPYYISCVAYPDCFDNGRTAADWQVSCDQYIYPRQYGLIIEGKGDVRLYAGTAYFTNDETYGGPQGDNTHSVLSPGSAPNVICVGMTGYRDHYVNFRDSTIYFGIDGGVINPHSSVGPTFDERNKPDVMAPGQNIISSYSSYYLEHNPDAWDISSIVRTKEWRGRTYPWAAYTGTSMSAPVVTGIIALWLEANPRLTPQDCLDIIAETSTHPDPALTYPNNYYGYGQIDAEAGIRLVLEKTTGIKQIEIKQPADNRIYTIDGRYVGIDRKRLPHGLYITNGKKIIL